MPRRMPTTLRPRFRAQARGGSLLPHAPTRRPQFPRSTPPPGPSAHPSGFSIRSQQDSFGFNPTAHQRLPFVPPLPRSSIPESATMIPQTCPYRLSEIRTPLQTWRYSAPSLHRAITPSAPQPHFSCGRENFSFRPNYASASHIVLYRPFHVKLRWWWACSSEAAKAPSCSDQCNGSSPTAPSRRVPSFAYWIYFLSDFQTNDE